jgi:hypothetical protein
LGVANPKRKEAYEKRIEEWKKSPSRYDSDPETQGGRADHPLLLIARLIREIPFLT